MVSHTARARSKTRSAPFVLFALAALTILPLLGSDTSQAQSTSTAPTLRFENEDGTTRQVATADVQQDPVTGRIELRIQDTDPAGFYLLADKAWIDLTVPNAASTHAYEVLNRDARSWYRTWIPTAETATSVVFESFTLQAGKRLYGSGALDTVGLTNRPMFVELLELPHNETITHTTTNANGTTTVTSTRWQQRIAIDFSDADPSGQKLLFSGPWLQGLGFRNPTWRYEDGSIIPSTRTPLGYEVYPPHFSVLYTFDPGEGWSKLQPGNYNELSWRIGLNMEAQCDRRDTIDELYVKYIGEFTQNSRFTVTSRWNLEIDNQGKPIQGNWQNGFPIFLANVFSQDLRGYQSTGNSQMIYVWYDSRDSNLNQDPRYVLRYTDNTNILRINEAFRISDGSLVFPYIDNNPSTGKLTMELRYGNGQVITDLDGKIARATYTFGTWPNDGFTINRVGIACDGISSTDEPTMWGYTDDVYINTYEPGAPQGPWTGCATHGITVGWSYPASDGGSPITQYKVYYRTTGGQSLLATVNAPTTSYVHTPSWSTTTYYYQISAVNAGGEGPKSLEVYGTPCDLGYPTVSGNPQSWTWRDTIPSLTGVSWQDTYSGLDTNAQYSVGTSSGATNVVAWTTMPNQPTLGQTTAWTPPAWSPSTLAQGTNYVNVKVYDRAGRLLQTNGAYTIQYDTLAPTASGAPATIWTNNANPTLTGVSFQDPHNGLNNNAAYWSGSTPGASDYLASTLVPSGSQPSLGQTTAWTPTFQPAAGAIQAGSTYVTLQVSDRLGHASTVQTYEVRLETNLPTIAGNPVATPWTSSPPTLSGVTWQDAESGLNNNAQYGIGTSSGATNVLGWTNLPTGSQPTAGQVTAWTPGWTPSTLAQGLNYVNMRVNDRAGNQRQTDGVYTVQYDTAAPTIGGSPAATSWTNITPTLTGVSWQDTYSGLNTNAQYSAGTTSGGTNVVPWTTLLVGQQPSLGQTTAWTPSFAPASLAQGLNYVNMRVYDAVGNLRTTNGAYTIQYDTASPTSAGAVITTAWTNANPTLTGVTFQDAYSGLNNNAAYWVGSTPGASDYLAATTLASQPTVGQTTTWSPSNFQVTAAALHQGSNYVTVRVSDTLGQTTTVQSYVIQHETVLPTVTGNPVATLWRNTLPSLTGVTFQDPTSGLQNTAQYSIGTTSGASNILGWATLAAGSQPAVGQTATYTPSFTPSTLTQGLNYVNMRVSDRAGNLLQTNGAYTIQYDTAVPTAAGNPQAWTWRNNIPTLGAVTWTDPLAGLATTVQYSVGTSSGATNVVAWTNLASGQQPTLGQTSAWTASFAPASLAQGLNYVNVRVTDQAGNMATTNGAYTIQYDTALPTSAGAPITTAWSRLNPTLSGVCHQDILAGLNNNAAYWVGSTPGASDYLASTLVPSGSQPSLGQTTNWCPSFQVSAAALRQGNNYVTLQANDRATNAKTTQSFQLRWDDVAESVPLPSALTNPGGSLISIATWQNDNTPYFSWTAPTSTSPIAGYSYSLSTSSLTNPDTITDTTNAFLDRATTPLGDGTWYFKVRSVDQAGNWGPVSPTFELRVDATLPGTPAIASTTHPDQALYYNRTTLTVSWSAGDALSGVDGYSFDVVTGTSPPALDSTKDAEEATTSTTYTNLGPFNVYSFRIKARDNAGNWGPTQTYTVRIDATPPSIVGVEPLHGSTVDNPKQPVRAFFDDMDATLDPLESATQVDASTVRLFVDGQEVALAWGGLCGPGGLFYPTGCKVERNAGGVTYEPLLPWQEGVHDAFVTLKDTAVDANTASAAWNFTVYLGTGIDSDGDRVPDALESELCGRPAIANAFNNPAVPGECATSENFVPPDLATTVFVPTSVILGPDADGDGVPARVTLQGFHLTLDPWRAGMVRITPANDEVVALDPDDADPDNPSTSTVGPVSVPIGVSHDGDADNDFIPHALIGHWLDITFDRTQGNPLILGGHTTSVTMDADDNNRNSPIAWGGIDADGDWLPDAVEPLICQAQNTNTPDDGRCVQPDGSGADGSGPNYVAPEDVPNPWTTTSPPSTFPNPRLLNNPDGTCTVYNDANNNEARDAGEIGGTVPCPRLRTQSNPDGTTTFYDDKDNDGQVDEGETITTTLVPVAAKMRDNPDGTCTFYDDANNNDQVDAGETLATTPCPKFKTRTEPDGSTTVYDDKNDNNEVDEGEPVATSPGNAKVKDNPDGTCTVYDDDNNNGVVDEGEAVQTVACHKPAARSNGDLTFTIYDDRNDNGAVDPGEGIFTTPPPILPPVGGPPGAGGGGVPLCFLLEDVYETHWRAFVLAENPYFVMYCG